MVSLRRGSLLAGLVASLCAVSDSRITVDDLNSHLVEAEYAVRGVIPDRAEELKKQIKANPTSHGLPFDSIIPCNIGNPQALGQKPLQFNREVISLVTNPELLATVEQNPAGATLFKADAIRRARYYLNTTVTGVGAYTHSQGFDVIRQEVVDFIARRDGHASSIENIFITDGASAGVRLVFGSMIRPGHQDGVLVPIPQYPLYSALTTMHDGSLVGYYLEEQSGWSVSVQELRRALNEAKARGVVTRALVIINPGNPTGQCLDENTMKDIVKFCVDENLVLLADEVYQENVYVPDKQFVSFKKVVKDMGAAASTLELISFHSVSKGFLGECGIRGGYLEMHNIDPAVKAQIYKLASVTLCANTVGQLAVGLMVKPPAPGDESRGAYVAQRDGILASLKRRSDKLYAALTALPGYSVQPSEGAMYLFPTIQLPKRAEQAAAAAKLAPDTYYCMQLLESTGIVTVAGSGFKQKDGTYHFRTTFLPPEDAMDQVIQRLSEFHRSFMARFSGDEL